MEKARRVFLILALVICALSFTADLIVFIAARFVDFGEAFASLATNAGLGETVVSLYREIGSGLGDYNSLFGMSCALACVILLTITLVKKELYDSKPMAIAILILGLFGGLFAFVYGILSLIEINNKEKGLAPSSPNPTPKQDVIDHPSGHRPEEYDAPSYPDYAHYEDPDKKK